MSEKTLISPKCREKIILFELTRLNCLFFGGCLTFFEVSMHMADALVSLPVGAAGWVISCGAAAGGVFSDIRRRAVSSSRALVAVSGAFVFTAQMINFAIPGTGSSGHITGSVLLSALLGGPAAITAIAAVLAIQAFVFADGGILALGCNIFNMGVIPCLLCYPLIYAPIARLNTISPGARRAGIIAASLAASIISAQLGAFMVVIETVTSGVTTMPFGIFAAAMLPIHLVIGAIEGVITAAIVCFIAETRPDMFYSAGNASKARKRGIVMPIAVLGVLAAAIGGFFYRFASNAPDGLEWSVARAGGSLEDVPEDAYGRFGGLSGIIGGLVVFIVCAAIAIVVSIVRKRRHD